MKKISVVVSCYNEEKVLPITAPLFKQEIMKLINKEEKKKQNSNSTENTVNTIETNTNAKNNTNNNN